MITAARISNIAGLVYSIYLQNDILAHVSRAARALGRGPKHELNHCRAYVIVAQ